MVLSSLRTILFIVIQIWETAMIAPAAHFFPKMSENINFNSLL